ncbi:unnamed protein product [Amoebophrya sp. A120]|nr:unnamed protein product [Amoebophrya sp. A120]|eukprot:GSA120T00015394001.1
MLFSFRLTFSLKPSERRAFCFSTPQTLRVLRRRRINSAFISRSSFNFFCTSSLSLQAMTLHQDDELATPIRAYIDDAAAKSSNIAAVPLPAAAPGASMCDDPKFSLLRSVGEECQSEPELRALLAEKPRDFVLYDGFEPSGRMHIAQGLMKSINVNKCTKAGGIFKFWVADWFGLMNNKMGGDLEKIKDVGKYLIECWKACGMNMERVKFIWTSEAIEQNAKEYWTQMLDISRLSSLWRIKKCGMIMGRKDEEALSGAQILYPIMQCTDIFFLDADICQLGVDQRKVNMLAREYCDAAADGRMKNRRKPIILSHHMLYGLFAGQEKMSKSNPDSAIFMEDSEEDVRRKLRNAYCPREPTVENSSKQRKLEEEAKIRSEQQTAAQNVSKKAAKKAAKGGGGGGAGDVRTAANQASLLAELEDDSMQIADAFDALKNPVLDYVKHIVFADPQAKPLAIKGKTYYTEQAVRQDFLANQISEGELKEAVIDRVNALLQNVRSEFQKNPTARRQLELVEQHKQAVTTGGPVKTSLRCLARSAAATNTVVFLPRPNATDINSCGLSLDVVLQTAATLTQAYTEEAAAMAAEKSIKTDSTAEEYLVTLYLEDWSSFVLNKYQGDFATLDNYHRLFLKCLRLVIPEVMASVLLLQQSVEICRDPNNYWISVIDVGRTCSLGDIRDMLLPSEEFVGSGQAVSSMMGVADVLSLSCLPSGAASSPSESSRHAVKIVACTEAQAVAFEKARNYIQTHIFPLDAAARRVGQVDVVRSAALFPTSAGPSVSADPAAKLELLIGDTAKQVDKKLKKLYCCEGDVEKNPVLEYLEQMERWGIIKQDLSSSSRSAFFHVERSGPEEVEKFGPEQKFQSFACVRRSFAQKMLHPRDLKVTAHRMILAAVNGVLAPEEEFPEVAALETFAQTAFGKKKILKSK